MTISFTIPGKPMGKGRPRFTGGHTYTPKETASYENLVKLTYRGGKLTGEITAEITAFFPIPKSATKRRIREMEIFAERPAKKPDVDNIAKIVLDSLNGLAYDDDSQVVILTVKKLYANEPRVFVSLSERKEADA